MVAGGDIRLDFARLVQLLKNRWGDRRGIDGLAADFQLRIGNDIADEEGILVALRALARIDIFYQSFIDRPCVDLAFPFVDELVA